MYRMVADVLLRKVPAEKIRDQIYAKDKQVNQKEREIRRKLVSHLSLSLADAPTCLVIMSVVKDIERIGDYCKNIFEVANIYTISDSQARYAGPLQEIGEEITRLFDKGRKAFGESDEPLAMEVIGEEQVIAKKCDMLIKQVLSDTLPTTEAVSTGKRRVKRRRGGRGHRLFPESAVEFP
jgi:Na+/phosphate symporter